MAYRRLQGSGLVVETDDPIVAAPHTTHSTSVDWTARYARPDDTQFGTRRVLLHPPFTFLVVRWIKMDDTTLGSTNRPPGNKLLEVFLVFLRQFLPGPASSQVGMALGLQLAGCCPGLAYTLRPTSMAPSALRRLE